MVGTTSRRVLRSLSHGLYGYAMTVCLSCLDATGRRGARMVHGLPWTYGILYNGLKAACLKVIITCAALVPGAQPSEAICARLDLRAITRYASHATHTRRESRHQTILLTRESSSSFYIFQLSSFEPKRRPKREGTLPLASDPTPHDTAHSTNTTPTV